MAKNTSEKILIMGAVLGGAYLLYSNFVSSEVKGSGEGSIGGSDDQFEDDLLGQQGFDIDPNSAYGVPMEPINPTPIPESKPDKVIPPPPNKRLNDPSAYDYTLPKEVISNANIAGGNPSKVTLPQYGLGVIGLTGSYASSFGKVLGEYFFKNTDDIGMSIFQRTQKEAIKDIPFIGKQADEFLFKSSSEIAQEGAESLGKFAIKETGEVAVEAGVKAGIKTAGTKLTGIGLKSIPLAGIGAGVAFDIGTIPELNARYKKGGVSKAGVLIESTTAQIVGDVLGSVGAVATTPAVATGVGAVVPIGVGIGGQIAGENLVYSTSGYFSNIANKFFNPRMNKKQVEETYKDFTSGNYVGVNQGTYVPDYAKVSFSPKTTQVQSSSKSSSSKSSSSSSSKSSSKVSNGKPSLKQQIAKNRADRVARQKRLGTI